MAFVEFPLLRLLSCSQTRLLQFIVLSRAVWAFKMIFINHLLSNSLNSPYLVYVLDNLLLVVVSAVLDVLVGCDDFSKALFANSPLVGLINAVNDFVDGRIGVEVVLRNIYTIFHGHRLLLCELKHPLLFSGLSVFFFRPGAFTCCCPVLLNFLVQVSGEDAEIHGVCIAHANV